MAGSLGGPYRGGPYISSTQKNMELVSEALAIRAQALIKGYFGPYSNPDRSIKEMLVNESLAEFADVYQNDKIYYKNSSGVITDAETYYHIIVEVSPGEKKPYIVDTESETSYFIY